MSGSSKMTIFLPTRLADIEEMKAGIINYLQLTANILTEDDLDANPSLGKGVKVAFSYFPHQAPSIIERKQNGLLPDLEMMCNCSAGIDDLPLEAMKNLSLRLTNTAGAASDSTADLAFGLLLASARNFKSGFEFAMNPLEFQSDQTVVPGKPGFDLFNAVIGIVGMGSIGYKVAKRAKGFGMHIHYHSRNRRSVNQENDVGATYHDNLHSLLKVSDFVVICCPHSPQTDKMFGREEFKLMKSTAHLINIGRGAIVNTDELVDALTSKEIYAAALDVTEPEPLPQDHPLLKMENVIILPHWGWYTRKAGTYMYM
ncbi:probable 2-ketogluconate reductase [Watersipora subatra]|uniref:probable 2-ketogluconate reductase n=1 Tax=Watersipora subatra TaxID=2589382 RepID=UPI00355BB8B2